MWLFRLVRVWAQTLRATGPFWPPSVRGGLDSAQWIGAISNLSVVTPSKGNFFVFLNPDQSGGSHDGCCYVVKVSVTRATRPWREAQIEARVMTPKRWWLHQYYLMHDVTHCFKEATCPQFSRPYVYTRLKLRCSSHLLLGHFMKGRFI